MNQHVSALVALLVIVATFGIAPTAALPSERPALQPVVNESTTTSYLRSEAPVERSEYASADIDVASALAAETAAIHSQYARHRLAQGTRTAPNEISNQAALRNAEADIDSQIESVRARDRAARRAFNNHEISLGTYLRRLAIITAEANALESWISQLDRYRVVTDDAFITTERIAEFKARLAPLQGPVRNRIRQAHGNEAAAERVYVETSSDGVILAMLDDSNRPWETQYVREAYVAETRDANGTDQFGEQARPLEAAVNRTADRYSWAFDNHQGYTVGVFGGEPYLYRAGVYAVGINHPHGTDRRFDLITYLDGGTGDVFYEIQYKSPNQVPTHAIGTNNTERLNMTLRGTRPGGPANVTVTNATGAPINASVSVDGTSIGDTGSDGVRWFVAPRGSVTVTAVADGEQITVSTGVR